MSYREVTMIEVKEVLRLWVGGTAKKRIAAMLGLDPKTVRRYIQVAVDVGLTPELTIVGEAELTAVLLALHPAVERPHGKTWAQCDAERDRITAWLAQGLRLTKVRKLHPAPAVERIGGNSTRPSSKCRTTRSKPSKGASGARALAHVNQIAVEQARTRPGQHRHATNECANTSRAALE